MQTNKVEELTNLAKEVAECFLEKYGGRSTEFLLAQSIWHDARLLRVQMERSKPDADPE